MSTTDTQGTDLSEAESVLRYDPFSADDGGSEPAAPEPVDGLSAETGVDGGDELEAVLEPAAPAEPAPPASTTDPKLTALLEQQTELLRTALAPPTAEPETQAEAPRFAVQLPDGLVAALNSDEPADRSAAIHTIVNGVANMAFTAAKEMVEARFQDFQKNLPQYIETHTEAATTQRDAQQMFYTAFPKLADPAIRGTVGVVAKEVGKQWMDSGKPFTGMTPEFAEAIAAAVAQKFSVPVAVFRAQAPIAPAAAPRPQKQAFAAPSTPRPSTQPSSEDVLAKLGLDF